MVTVTVRGNNPTDITIAISTLICITTLLTFIIIGKDAVFTPTMIASILTAFLLSLLFVFV